MKGASPQPETGRSRKRLIWWGGIAGAIILLISVAAILLLTFRSNAQADLEAKLEELEAAGVPISLEEVNRRYHGHGRDPEGNAAPLYNEAFEQRVIDEVPMEEFVEALPKAGEFRPLTEEVVVVLEEVISANEVALSLLKEAAAQPYFRADIDFGDAADVIGPHLGDFRDSARLFTGGVVLVADAGDTEAASGAVEAIYRMARHLADEPALTSQLTRIALESFGRTALEQMLARAKAAPNEFKMFQDLLDSIETGPRLRPALEAELARFGQGENVYEIIGDEAEPGIWQRALFSAYRGSGMQAKDQAFYLSEMTEVLRVEKMAPEDRVHVEWEEVDFSGIPSVGKALASIMLPTMGRVLESDNRAITYLRATRIALAAEKYRLEHGGLPAAPEALVPDYMEELPVDPYNPDGAFEFVAADDAFFVRSAGIIEGRDGEEDRPIQFRLAVRGD